MHKKMLESQNSTRIYLVHGTTTNGNYMPCDHSSQCDTINAVVWGVPEQFLFGKNVHGCITFLTTKHSF